MERMTDHRTLVPIVLTLGPLLGAISAGCSAILKVRIRVRNSSRAP